MASRVVEEGELLWTPSPERVERANLTRYRRWLAETRGLRFADYNALWRWSTTEIEAFWASLWDSLAIQASRPPERVLAARVMPGARWFEGAELNYTEHVFRHD